MEAQIGRETTPKEYISRLTEVFTEVRRVLRPDGTLWLNISDTYAGKGNQGDFIDLKNPYGRNGQAVALNNKVEGCKPKDMIGIPWMLAFALRDTGWYLRNDIIWMKDNPMPESQVQEVFLGLQGNLRADCPRNGRTPQARHEGR